MTVVTCEELTALYSAIARAVGAPEDEARVFAHCMVRADLRGMPTQGAAIVPYVVSLVEQGLARFGAPFTVLSDHPAAVLVDGGGGVGSVVGTNAMDLAISKAKSAGMCAVWVRAGGDFAMASNHALQAVEHDQVGIVMRNGSPRVAPWGGRDPFFGTDPLSVAVPTDREPPIVIDMASGSYSVGQVVMAARDGAQLPGPYLVDRDGKYTSDPSTIIVDASDRESEFSGGIVSLGHKGMAWVMIVEVLAGLLSGLGTSNQNAFMPSAEKPWREGMVFLAIDIASLLPVSDFKTAADALVQSLRAARPAQGFERVRVPGELEDANERRRRRDGIPLRAEDWSGVLTLAARLGIETPDSEIGRT